MEILNTVIHDSTKTSDLCRICLAESKSMTYLKSEFRLASNENSLVSQVLCEIMSTQIIENDKYPSSICSMCMSILKLTYKLKLQFLRTQKLLNDYFGECVITTECDQKASVEIISKQGKYNLDDVFVVEDINEEKPTFEGFLKNLGREVSVKFVTKNLIECKGQAENSMLTVVNNFDVYTDIKNTNAQSEHETKCDINVDTVDTRVCDVCNKIFDNRRNLQRHIKTHLSRRENYLCEICGHVARTKSAFRYHSAKHYKKKYKCDRCGKMFFCNSTLQQHFLSHKNERLHLCTICGKSFNYSNALKYHMLVHTGEKKYKCTYCDRRFSMQCSWKRHLRTHTGVRPFCCSYCDKAFRSKGEVACHEMGHTGYRPYHCKFCGKGFTKTHNLKMHILGHAGPHVCEFCGRSFIEINFLKIHKKSTHGLKEESEKPSLSFY